MARPSGDLAQMPSRGSAGDVGVRVTNQR